MERKEAIEVIKKNWPDSSFTRLRDALETLIPELKESEDENIRKQIKAFIKSRGSQITQSKTDAWLAWLKKQGEHANFRNKIQIGDKVTRNEDGVLVNLSQLKRIAKPTENKGKHGMGISEATKQKLEDNLNKALEKETPESCNEFLDKQGEQNPDKIVEKAKTEKQRVLLTETDGTANIDWDCRSLDDVKILLKCGLEFIRTIEANKQILADNRFGGPPIRVPNRYDKDIKQGEQKPVIKMKTPEESLGIDSDTYNKIVDECVYGEQKPAWSEDDEENRKNILYILNQLKGTAIYKEDKTAENCIDWLKSLRPQKQWKPTKEQIMALRWVLNHIPYDSHKEEINGLVEQLIKLYNYEENR